jgi:hypothetical protein
MYNISVQSMQVLSTAVVHVSISETDESGTTRVLAVASTTCDLALPGHRRESLASYCYQVVEGVADALSTGRSRLDNH